MTIRVYADGRVYFNTLDAQTVAADAETGEDVWRVQLGDINRGETMTMAPLVVKGKVLVGNSGGEMGVRGWLTALDAATGEIARRAWSTGPDADALIGEDLRPFYADHRGDDLGVRTWTGEQWKIGGGTVWGWISYDPALDLIHYGTDNAGVWNPALRPGDDEWSVTIFARDPDDGMARWAYRMVPHDEHDHDGVNESVLVELPIDGRELWRSQTGSGIIGQPVTYRGPDGRQYVAVLAGVGGWAGASALGILPEDDPTIALGFGRATRDLPKYAARGGTLDVFALR